MRFYAEHASYSIDRHLLGCLAGEAAILHAIRAFPLEMRCKLHCPQTMPHDWVFYLFLPSEPAARIECHL